MRLQDIVTINDHDTVLSLWSVEGVELWHWRPLRTTLRLFSGDHYTVFHFVRYTVFLLRSVFMSASTTYGSGDVCFLAVQGTMGSYEQQRGNRVATFLCYVSAVYLSLLLPAERLKMQEGQKCKGGKCRSIG